MLNCRRKYENARTLKPTKFFFYIIYHMPDASFFTYHDLKSMPGGAITVIEEYKKLPEDTVNLKLNPETWSCTEVCQHLIRFNEIYLDIVDELLHNGSPQKTDSNQFKPGWISKKIIHFIEPPYKVAIKTVAPMFPSKIDASAAETFEKLIETEKQLIELLDDAEKNALNLDRMKGFNPVFKFVRMSVTEFVLMLDAHQRRHFWQIEQILKRLPTD